MDLEEEGSEEEPKEEEAQAEAEAEGSSSLAGTALTIMICLLCGLSSQAFRGSLSSQPTHFRPIGLQDFCVNR